MCDCTINFVSDFSKKKNDKFEIKKDNKLLQEDGPSPLPRTAPVTKYTVDSSATYKVFNVTLQKSSILQYL